MSTYSRHRTVGEPLGRGKPLDDILATMRMVAEGVGTARIALSLAERYEVELPICAEIHTVVTGEQRPVDAYCGLRAAGHKSDPDRYQERIGRPGGSAPPPPGLPVPRARRRRRVLGCCCPGAPRPRAARLPVLGLRRPVLPVPGAPPPSKVGAFDHFGRG